MKQIIRGSRKKFRIRICNTAKKVDSAMLPKTTPWIRFSLPKVNAAQNDPLNQILIAKSECWQLSYHAEFDHIPVSQYPNDRFMDITNALYQHGTKVPVVFLQVLLCYSASFLILDITTELEVLLIRVLKIRILYTVKMTKRGGSWELVAHW